ALGSRPPMTAAPNALDYRALLARQDWVTLRKNLKLYAWKATGSRSMDRAEDIAHDAIARLWEDAGVRWDPQAEPNLFRFLTGLVRGDLSNERRLKATTDVDLPGPQAVEALRDKSEPGAETLLIRAESVHRIFSPLRERTASDAVASAVVDLFARGIDGAADQVEASGHSIDDIRRARRRVFDHVAAIKRELGDPEVP
ncbi:MAG: hypothetical protein ACLQVI_14550, partial [Polyangiaceae bacterium]